MSMHVVYGVAAFNKQSVPEGTEIRLEFDSESFTTTTYKECIFEFMFIGHDYEDGYFYITIDGTEHVGYFMNGAAAYVELTDEMVNSAGIFAGDIPTDCSEILGIPLFCYLAGCYWYDGGCHSSPKSSATALLLYPYAATSIRPCYNLVANPDIVNVGATSSKFNSKLFLNPNTPEEQTLVGWVSLTVEPGETWDPWMFKTLLPKGELHSFGIKTYSQNEPEPDWTDVGRTFMWEGYQNSCEDLTDLWSCHPDFATEACCYYYNNGCHTNEPTCEELTHKYYCDMYSYCYYYDDACHSSSAPTCEDYTDQTECEAHDCYWYNDSCHSEPEPPPDDLCAWILAQVPGYPSQPVTDISIESVFTLVDSYLFQTSPLGYSFIPTIQQVFGVIDYYLGIDGDAGTGCDFFT